MNLSYLWDIKQAQQNKNLRTPFYYEERKQRKKAKKKLSAIQQPGRWSHDMDEDMFDSICEMLTSQDRRDKVMALDIILSSKMVLRHMDYFTQNHHQIILNGIPEDYEYIWNRSTSSFSLIP